jgi:hypothetical protein
MATADQDRVIAELDKLNAQASNLDGCDPSNAPALEDLDNRMAELRLLLTASGLEQDEVGKWRGRQ